MRVLIVEDEPKLASLLRKGLTAQGLAADIASDGDEAMYMATATSYDAITLDVMLPDTDGFTLCREFRRNGVTTPVLMITALDTIHDRVTGLDSGADDYLAKPFSFAELLARLRALVRRPREVRMPVLTVGELQLDPATRTVHRGDVQIELTRKEFAMLEALMRRPGEAVSRFDLLECAWDDSYDNRSNIVDVYIGYLRQKVDRPFGIDTIETVRGFGYRLRTEETG
ncbi:MAG TPA: response regulator transcription factor [Propionibacteriaceae bacterium]|nr:response regulator transcription factor [Propionibacteriaceae bacterium]